MNICFVENIQEDPKGHSETLELRTIKEEEKIVDLILERLDYLLV